MSTDYNQAMKKHIRTQRLRKASKKTKQNRTKTKQPRRKNWVAMQGDDMEHQTRERVMPRGEVERRKATEAMVYQEPTVESGDPEALANLPEGQNGLVVEVGAGSCWVDLEGETLLCSLRGALRTQETGFTNVVAVGDRVIVNPNGPGRGVVEAALPRRSMLTRPDVFYTHLRQVVVANVDQVLIVSSWRAPHFWPELVDRYLIAADRSDLDAVLCINKVDLVDEQNELQETLAPYQKLGLRVMLTSAETGAGIEHLRDLLQERTTVLAGLSGVGKSSLLTAIQPSLNLRVGEVSRGKIQTGQGRHTTTAISLLKLENDITVVDTPGIKEFGLAGLRQSELADWFPEIAAQAGGCRFNDCAHVDEPGCAVRTAVGAGEVAESRYKSYQLIHATLPA